MGSRTVLKFKSICLVTTSQCKWKINIYLVRGVKTCSIVIFSFKMILQIIATQNINWRKCGKLSHTYYILIADNKWPELKQKARLCNFCGCWGSRCALKMSHHFVQKCRCAVPACGLLQRCLQSGSRAGEVLLFPQPVCSQLAQATPVL